MSVFSRLMGSISHAPVPIVQMSFGMVLKSGKLDRHEGLINRLISSKLLEI